MRKYNLIVLIMFCWAYPLYALEVVYQYDDLNRLTQANYGNGQQTITYAYDAAGNILSKDISVSEQLPPSLVITTPAEGAIFTSNNIIISGTASDAGRGDSGISTVTVNDQAASGATATGADTANWSLAATLTYGENSLIVVASDGSPFANKTTQTLNIRHHPPFIDSDGDGIDDNWEQYYFNNLAAVNATTDSDGDGTPDLAEYEGDSDPTNPRSRFVDTQQALIARFQPLFYPLDEPVMGSAFALLTQLGTLGVAVTEIQALDQKTGAFQSAQLDPASGALFGDDFELVSGQGVFARVTKDSVLSLKGAVSCQSIDLYAGINIVGFQCLPSEYSAYQLLNAIGDSTVVTSIQRFDPITGRFQTSVYEAGVANGSDFLILVGEAYLIHMNKDYSGFDPVNNF